MSDNFRATELNDDFTSKQKELAQKSFEAEKELVANDNITLAEYIDNYYKSICI